jgi:ATP-binding cassette, subfamily B, bacterial
LLIDWQFALVSLLVVPALMVVVIRFRRRVKQIAREVRSNEGAIASLAQEVLSSIRVVKAFGQEDREHARFVVQARAQVDAQVRSATWQALFSLCVNLVTTLGVAVALGYGGVRVMRGELTLGEVLVFIQYLNTLYSPLRQFGRLASVVQTASASAERIDELFQAATEVPESPTAVALNRVRGTIAFEQVWFGYDLARPVLCGVDLHIGAGEVVAVLGPTGAGKSSLVSLIPRFYDPGRGRVLLDGQDLRTLRLRSLRQQISLVLQEPFLFSGSIFENIAYGRPGASSRAVLEAASAANADEFIERLPEGYDTPVGERGVTLSGGQRQRIAIARALLMDTPILILDEPTSAIDRDSEAVIMQALRRLIHGRTVIIISHRESATALAERVVVLRNGSIVESGRRATLEAWHAYLARSPRVEGVGVD